MADKQPTPLRKRTSADPQPIRLAPRSLLDIPVTPRNLYYLMRSEEQVNIKTITVEEFEAFWQRVMDAE